TSGAQSGAAGGHRKIFHADSRIGIADGTILLGRRVDRDDLVRLVGEGHAFVSVGRRDDAGGPVPYVGADYRTAVAALVERVAGAGRPVSGRAGRAGRRRTARRGDHATAYPAPGNGLAGSGPVDRRNRGGNRGRWCRAATPAVHDPRGRDPRRRITAECDR